MAMPMPEDAQLREEAMLSFWQMMLGTKPCCRQAAVNMSQYRRWMMMGLFRREVRGTIRSSGSSKKLSLPTAVK